VVGFAADMPMNKMDQSNQLVLVLNVAKDGFSFNQAI